MLDDLADYGPQLLATVGTRMQAVRATGTEWLHSDTTAYALFGDYSSDSMGPTAPVELTWGHTKDHRPDLKQIMAGVTMDAEGVRPRRIDAVGEHLRPPVEYGF